MLWVTHSSIRLKVQKALLPVLRHTCRKREKDMIKLGPWTAKRHEKVNYENTATAEVNIDSLTYMLRRMNFSDAYEHPAHYVNSISDPYHFMDARLSRELQMRRWGRAARRIRDKRLLSVISPSTAGPSLGDSYMRGDKVYVRCNIGGKSSSVPAIIPPGLSGYV